MKKLTNRFCVENRLSYFPFYVQFILSFILAYSFYRLCVAYVLGDKGTSLEDIIFVGIFLFIILFSGTLQQLVACLDRAKPWLLYLPHRLLIQFVMGVMLPSVPTAVGMAFFFSLIIEEWTVSMVYVFALYPATLLLIVVINLLYLIWFFIHFSLFMAKLYAESNEQLSHLQDQADSQVNAEGSGYLRSLEVRVGFRRELLFVKDIGIFEASAERRTCTLKQGGARYDFDYSLDMLAARLDPRKFYKVSRRYILNRAVIMGYKDRRNGSLLIRLNREAQAMYEITVSRGFAKEFKNWYIGAG
ncbi:LytTR family DNA-binding domain-containing protein [Sphingobacterium bambusae]|uniref:LytTR family DNA-binding domain-containing protein n=1 Tax=Sphingobacterium bambusae TaxID=662858 RepID=A0ABW6BN20_9SPHI|nr:LytTR family DNA-binding domain-containing protein [Sphingobacterium bambusae]WPL48177.1 LytTR family DNA-binding domain-containing protein [Sphingobacterium bambusae]